MFGARDQAHRIHEDHGVIHGVPVLEPVRMSGAFLVAGPFRGEPGFPHPLERIRSKQRERF